MRNMKYSGTNWIDCIPEEWNAVNIRYLFSFGKGLPITKDNLLETGVPVISYGQIHSKVNKGTTISPSLIRYVDDAYLKSNSDSLVKKGDFIFADTSEDLTGCGNCVYVDTDDTLFAGYHAIILRNKAEYSNRYLAYLFSTDAWRKQIRERVTGVKLFSISQKILRETTVIIPPRVEQEKISRFLDAECARIDAVMEQTRASIEEYKKLKQSIITEAVTKGIRPNRPMKDSGIDWIGQIPENWDYTTVGRIATVVRGASPRPAGDPRYFNGDAIPWITVAEVTNGSGKYIYKTDTFLTEEGAKHSRIVESGTLLLSNSGATLGVPKITTITGCINDGSVAFYDLKIEQDYLLYVFSGRTFELRKQMQGYGQPNLNTAIVKSLWIPLPPKEEQKEIVTELDAKTAKIEALIYRKEHLLSELESYKKSLIYEYVTGKKEA